MSAPQNSAFVYDANNIFAQMIRGEKDYDLVYEDDYVLSIKDAFPKTRIHVLVLPKGAYISSRDFHEKASSEDIAGYYKGISKTLDALGLTESDGYRLISNAGPGSGQVVFHYHTHILAGEPLLNMYG